MFHGGGGFGGHGGGYHGGHGGLHGAADAEFDDDVLGKVYDNRVVARMLPYLAKVKGKLSVGVFGVVVRTVATLAGPYMIAEATNYILDGNLTRLGIIAIAFLIAQGLLFAGQYLETLFMAYAGQSMLLTLRTDMFNHLHKLSMSFFDRNKVGKLMSRVQNDVNQMQQFLAAGVVELLASVLTLVGIAVVDYHECQVSLNHPDRGTSTVYHNANMAEVCPACLHQGTAGYRCS